MTSLSSDALARELQHVRAHHQVGVPEASGIHAVRTDAADFAGQVVHALGLGVAKESLGVFPLRQVVVGPARYEDVVAVCLEPLDEVRAEKAASPRHEGLHAGARVCVSQSTRPIQRGRFSAYHAIVRATPSSHETCGSQPVSRLSFS